MSAPILITLPEERDVIHVSTRPIGVRASETAHHAVRLAKWKGRVENATDA